MRFSLLFYVLLLFIIYSCNVPKEVSLPNKNIKVKNSTLYYKLNPFSGKLLINPTHNNKLHGFFSFKKGKFEGETNLKNETDKKQIKFTRVNGKFEGEFIMIDPEQKLMVKTDIKNRIIVKSSYNLNNNLKHELTFKNGLANGSMEVEQTEFIFNNGTSFKNDTIIKLLLMRISS